MQRGWVMRTNVIGSGRTRSITTPNTGTRTRARAGFELGKCVLSTSDDARKYGRSITEIDCVAEGGSWVKFNSFLEVLTDITSQEDCESAAASDGSSNSIVWDKLRSDDDSEVCIVQAPVLTCQQAPWTRVNHLGNSYNYDQDSKYPNASRFEFDLPHFPSGEAKRDIIENDPEIDLFGDGSGVEIALNTAQVGRTFQDRSHIFQVRDIWEVKTWVPFQSRIHNPPCYA
eukprot:sb/3469497/